MASLPSVLFQGAVSVAWRACMSVILSSSAAPQHDTPSRQAASQYLLPGM
eukprot:CAMPEP_0114617958 /NCGR_PEP_ID=MMETSP0168-20121206/7462_1 /TAXON_ID=95228 ORGANISM="Vannella sp., Strain DIVA3 517/6/12" /NCGR_SAMPLE_ID=MMETSP0168 /ASSEMBLY_ACC=CAM_ASM_000044 /LENGTH=49 /DNA_ID=CAMNT_0001829103 /DNA_START=257 /DNA_END=406 /DNA_ORIENTATION=-